MSLSGILASVPKHQTTLPLSGKRVEYRPFIVKEEKILLMAAETRNEKSIYSAIREVVLSCTGGKVDVTKIPILDMEYLFLQLRSQSVGETTKPLIKCEKCEAAFVSPTRGPRRGDPCPHCGGDIITLGAGYPTRDADGAIASMDPVSMLSREVAEAVRVVGIDYANRTMTDKPLPKNKKRSGKSPTRKVVLVARSWRARDERMLARPRESVTLGGDPLDAAREAYPDAPVSAEVVAQMPELNRLATVPQGGE